MNITELSLRIASATVYKGVINAPVVRQICEYVRLKAAGAGKEEIVSAAAAVFCSALEFDKSSDICGAFVSAAETDENPVSRALAFGEKLQDDIKSAALFDLETLVELMHLCPEKSDLPAGAPVWTSEDKKHISADTESFFNYLKGYYEKNGYGIVSRHSAFKYEGGLIPAVNTDKIRLASLKSYDAERAVVKENTEAFVKGLPAQNVLLYGDRGTGKSATIHALLNEYSGRGLRMIELAKNNLSGLSSLIGILSRYPNRFIIYIDDLSLSGDEAVLSDLKAVLEGSLEKRPDNILVYATSNRRHLVKEKSTSELSKETNDADAREEMLSLSDRFGLTVTFFNPNLKVYREIVAFLAKENGINIDEQTLFAAADRFAVRRGVRSPRTAQQFIEYAAGRINLGLDL